MWEAIFSTNRTLMKLQWAAKNGPKQPKAATHKKATSFEAALFMLSQVE
jgi:hypothetical protein